MTSVIQGCLGCGIHTDAPSHLCSRCERLVEYERYYHSESKTSGRLKAQKFCQKLPGFLPKMMFTTPVLVTTLAGILLITAVLCQSFSLDCSLFKHCLLS